jgi:hypothetical protein
MATLFFGRRAETCLWRKVVMRIYNKGQREFVIAKEDMLLGPDSSLSVNKKHARIVPEQDYEVTDEVAERLLKNYPKEIIPFGRSEKKKTKKKE